MFLLISWSLLGRGIPLFLACISSLVMLPPLSPPSSCCRVIFIPPPPAESHLIASRHPQEEEKMSSHGPEEFKRHFDAPRNQVVVQGKCQFVRFPLGISHLDSLVLVSMHISSSSSLNGRRQSHGAAGSYADDDNGELNAGTG